MASQSIYKPHPEPEHRQTAESFRLGPQPVVLFENVVLLAIYVHLIDRRIKARMDYESNYENIMTLPIALILSIKLLVTGFPRMWAFYSQQTHFQHLIHTFFIASCVLALKATKQDDQYMPQRPIDSKATTEPFREIPIKIFLALCGIITPYDISAIYLFLLAIGGITCEILSLAFKKVRDALRLSKRVLWTFCALMGMCSMALARQLFVDIYGNLSHWNITTMMMNNSSSTFEAAIILPISVLFSLYCFVDVLVILLSCLTELMPIIAIGLLIVSEYIYNLALYTFSLKRNVYIPGAGYNLLGFISLTNRDRVPRGYRCLRWKCSCGEALAASFNNANPQAVYSLDRKLQGIGSPGDEDSPGVSLSIAPLSNHVNETLLLIRENVFGSCSTRRAGLTISPDSHPGVLNATQSINPAITMITLDGSSTVTNAGESNSAARYFEVCVNVGKHKVGLGEVNISSVTTDDQLFDEIWKTYRELRGSTWRTALRRWFLKPHDISFVFFGVLSTHAVGIYRKPLDIPPQIEVNEGRYHYHECPMEDLPPIPGNIFLHYLNHAKRKAASKRTPALSHTDSTFLDRLPKKLGRSIFTERPAVSSQSTSYGWGVHILERTSTSAFYVVVGLVAVISAAICLASFAFTWWLSGLDEAIGIGQYAGTVLGIIDAAIYFALQTYCASLSNEKP